MSIDELAKEQIVVESHKFMTLTEAVPGGSGDVKVKAVDRNGGEHEVLSWLGVIAGAPVGYEALFVKVDGEWVFNQGPTFNSTLED